MEKHKLMKPKVLKVPKRQNWSVMMDKLNQLEIKWTLINTNHLLHLLKKLRSLAHHVHGKRAKMVMTVLLLQALALKDLDPKSH
jgi:hypothetical protein